MFRAYRGYRGGYSGSGGAERMSASLVRKAPRQFSVVGTRLVGSPALVFVLVARARE